MKVDTRKTYIFYKSIVDAMGLSRPDWNRFVWTGHYPDEEEYWGFKEEKNLLMFKLAIGENI